MLLLLLLMKKKKIAQLIKTWNKPRSIKDADRLKSNCIYLMAQL